ncbi:MAG: hypothetical protein ACRDIL_18575 [Candidatus Limnocylindrales bacterium]
MERGRLDSAEALLDEGLHLSLEAKSANNVAVSLDAFAQLAIQQGDWEQAARVAGAAEGLRRTAGIQPWPALRANAVNAHGQIREALGPGRFDELFAAGATLSQKQAVAAVRDRHRSDTQAS